MQETESVKPTDAFLQGDIMRIVDANEDPSMPPYGIVINADCDLAHCKIDGVVSYIPLFPFETYFATFWVPTFIETRQIELLDTLAQICGFTREHLDPLEAWLREEGTQQVACRLAQTYQVKLAVLIPKLQELEVITTAEHFDINLLRNIIKVQNLNANDALAKYAKRALKALGEGSFFLNEIVDVPQIGFVARMKRIYSLDVSSVFRSISDFRLSTSHSTQSGIRVAKLTNVYRFRIAQLFAYQFSRIGVPDELTSLNEVAVQAAVANLGVGDD